MIAQPCWYGSREQAQRAGVLSRRTSALRHRQRRQPGVRQLSHRKTTPHPGLRRSGWPTPRRSASVRRHHAGLPRRAQGRQPGRVYASGFSGVQVCNLGGDLIGEIHLPGAVNFTFGGAGRRLLFIITDTAIWGAFLAAQGARRSSSSTTTTPNTTAKSTTTNENCATADSGSSTLAMPSTATETSPCDVVRGPAALGQRHRPVAGAVRSQDCGGAASSGSSDVQGSRAPTTTQSSSSLPWGGGREC